MCIATTAIVSAATAIAASIASAVASAASAVTGAVTAAGTAVGSALGSVGSFFGSIGSALGIGGGASAAGSAAAGGSAGGAAGLMGMSSLGAASGAGLSTQAVGYSILGIPTTTGAFGTLVPAYLPAAAAGTSVAGSAASAVGAGGAAAASSIPWGAIGSIGLTALGTGASVAGSLLGTVANMQNLSAQQDTLRYLAAQEEVNGILASRQGERIDLQANQERLQLHNKMLQSQGDARASFAARGVALGSGTANDYEADIADAYDLDSRNLEYDVASRKWKYKVEASSHFTQAGIYRNQASALDFSKSASLLGGLFGTAGGVMSGITSGLNVSSKLGWI